ncbi:MAG TPA: CoA-binding protein [Baekduia sp.]|nr:CoA-binding protein [Baekduia sp.]
MPENVENIQTTDPSSQCSGADVLQRALTPSKIAIFGASSAPQKMGYMICKDLLSNGYAGELVFVNRRGGDLLGHPMTADVADAAGADFAMLTVPAPACAELVGTCGELSIPLVIVGAGGFAEDGNPQLERELVAASRAAGVRLIGPNCVGPHVSDSGIVMSTIPLTPAGSVSLISQSGGIPIQAGIRLEALGSGFDAIVTLGNKVDLGFSDALLALARRPQTESILMYMEGHDEGDDFFDALTTVTAEVPVVAMIGGETAVGAQAAHSHTASMLSRWSRLAGMVADCGAQVARAPDEAYAAAATARRRSRVARGGDRVMLLCHGGAFSVILADAFARSGFRLPTPSAALAETVSALISRPVINPIEFASSVDHDYRVMAQALELVLASGEYDAVLLATGLGGYGAVSGDAVGDTEMECARMVSDLVRGSATPVIVQSTHVTLGRLPALELLREAGVSFVEWPDEAVAAIALALGHPLPRVESAASRPAIQDPAPTWDARLGAVTDRVVDALEAGGVKQAVGRVVTREQLLRTGDDVGVLRLDGFSHKTAAGAIALGVGPAERAGAFERLAAVAEAHAAPAAIRWAPMIDHDHELLVTFWRDAREGRGWAVGAGGVATEAARDVTVGAWPRNAADVERALARTAVGAALVDGGGSPLSDAVAAILAIAEAFDGQLHELAELECNPIGVGPSGAWVLDVLPSF